MKNKKINAGDAFIDLGDPMWSKEEDFVNLLECQHSNETFKHSVTLILGENWRELGWEILKSRPTQFESLSKTFQAYLTAIGDK